MELTNAQWEAIRPFIPEEELEPPKRTGGRPYKDARSVLEGILWILRTGASWTDLPAKFPPFQTCHRRFQRWVDGGVLPEILAALRRDLEGRGGFENLEAFIDGSYVPAKKGDLVLESLVPEKPRKSWHWRTAMVFRSLSILKEETDMTLCSPTQLSTLLSYRTFLKT
jgi:transposase